MSSQHYHLNYGITEDTPNLKYNRNLTNIPLINTNLKNKKIYRINNHTLNTFLTPYIKSLLHLTCIQSGKHLISGVEWTVLENYENVFSMLISTISIRNFRDIGF